MRDPDFLQGYLLGLASRLGGHDKQPLQDASDMLKTLSAESSALKKLLAAIAVNSETPEGDEFFGDVLCQPLRDRLEAHIKDYDMEWVKSVCAQVVHETK